MRSAVRIVIAAAALLAASPARAEKVLRVSGTGSGLGTMRLLAAAFEKATPGHRVQVLGSIGSGGAIRAVADRALDVGLSGRELHPEERRLGVLALAYARTPFVFAAGPRSGVTGIGAADLARIYRGEMRTWPSGERVRLVLRPRSDADTGIVAAISPEMREAVEISFRREGLIMAATNQDCNDVLSRTPGSFGPTSLTQILTEGRPVTALAWNGVAPTLANLASGSYPLDKLLYVVVHPAPTARTKRFLAFLSTPEARSILERTGNLPLPLPAPE